MVICVARSILAPNLVPHGYYLFVVSTLPKEQLRFNPLFFGPIVTCDQVVDCRRSLGE